MKKGLYLITAEIPINLSQSDFVYFSPNVIGFVSDGNYNGLINSVFQPENIKNDSVVNVFGLEVDGIKYTAVDNGADLLANEKAFFWEAGRKLLRIHLPAGVSLWSISTVTIGVSLAFYRSNMTLKQFDGQVGDVKYERRLESVSEITEQFDNIQDGKMVIASGSLSIQNNDGKYSRLNEDDNYINKLVKVSSWFSDQSSTISLTQEFNAIINSIKTGPYIYIDYIDPRGNFPEKVPSRKIDINIWTDCDSNYIIPEIWGLCPDVPLQCINKNQTGTTWQLILGDITYLNIQSVSVLYYNGNPIDTLPTILTADNIAYLEVSSATYEDSDGFTADVNGYETAGNVLIENPLDILENKFQQIYGKTYSSVYYDTTAWAYSKARVYDIALFINDEIELKEMIQNINGSSGGRFFIDRHTDKYSYEILFDDLSSQISIPEIRFIPEGDRNIVDYNPEKIIQIASINYSKRWKKNKYLTYTNTSKQAAIKSILNSDGINKPINTFISKLSDAQDFSNKILFMYGRKIRFIEKTIPLNSVYNNIQAGKLVSLECNSDGYNLGFMRTLILYVKKDFNNNNVAFNGWMLEPDVSGFLLFNDDGTIFNAAFNDNGEEYLWYTI